MTTVHPLKSWPVRPVFRDSVWGCRVLDGSLEVPLTMRRDKLAEGVPRRLEHNVLTTATFQVQVRMTAPEIVLNIISIFDRSRCSAKIVYVSLDYEPISLGKQIH